MITGEARFFSAEISRAGEKGAADSGLAVRRDVGGIDRSELGIEVQAAAEVRLARGGMAARAIADESQIAAARDRTRLLDGVSG